MPPTLQELARKVGACAVRDQRRLAARLTRVLSELRAGRAAEADVEEIARAIHAAEARVHARGSRVPAITFPPDLPVSQRREEIRAAIAGHQVVVVCGETGSGKTTQLPKICLELGLGVRGMIGHTQPRRIAARSVASRVADELGTPLGDIVGYKVRFGDHTSERTMVKVMTDGILLAETQNDRDLEQYDTLIIDEAHERSLNIDFLLGYLRTLLPRRPDLKIIVTSATIDPDRFASHFSHGRAVPIVTVEGRAYPVEVLYREPSEQGLDERDEGMQRHIVDAVDECATRGEGDILVFLSGEREIRETAESLSKHHVPGAPGTRVLPLFARLSAADQMEVFRPHAHRRIILATNVAETSLTVPGIRYVVDTGVARMSRYNPRTKAQRLEVEAVSRASADQRAGRCGRVGPGVCVRLYSEEDYRARPRYTDPEIVRTNLASVILQMIFLKLGHVEKFPFIDPPDSRFIKDGYDTLRELGAISPQGELTRLGREMARLPIDPRVSRMLLAARDEPGSCLADVLVIAAALSIQDPRERPMDARQDADAAHAAFRDPASDFLGHLRLWDWYQERKRHLSSSKLRKACKESFVSFVRLREWEDVHRQLAELLGSMMPDASPARRTHDSDRRHAITERSPLRPVPEGGPDKPDQARADAIHRALLAGLLSNVGVKGESGEYAGARGGKFRIFPGSALFKTGPRWVIASEIVRTSAVYARAVAGVDPDWIERAAQHVVARSHSDPHWDAQSGRVMAFERVMLFGLELVSRRRVHYGPIHPAHAREVFILHALVRGEMLSEAPFYAHNMRLLQDIQRLEVRSRQIGRLALPHRRFAFYDARIPPGVCTTTQLERWLKTAPARTAQSLRMTPEDIVEPGVRLPTGAEFPDAIECGTLTLPLDYRCDPGHEADGVTIRLPLEALAHVPEQRFAWLVPGMLADRIDATLKGLPKEHRRLLSGSGELGVEAASRMPFGDGSLFARLSQFLQASARIDVPREVLERVVVPDHLRMRFEVLDAEGNLLLSGRDLAAIRAHLAAKVRSSSGGVVTHGAERFNRDGLTTWDFGDLPECVEIDRFGTRFVTFPALVDAGSAVKLRLFESRTAAEEANRAGLRRLFMLDAGEEVRRATHRHPDIERLCVLAGAMGRPEAFRASFIEHAVDRALRADLPPPRTPGEFKARSREAVGRLGDAVREACSLAEPVLRGYHAVSLGLGEKHPAAWTPVISDIRDQLSVLMAPDFMVRTREAQLRHYPRYLAAIETRLRRLSGAGLPKDLERLAELTPIWQGYHELSRRQRELGIPAAAVEEYRWMVEELRVSMFAQELRTAIPVSVKRLHEKWESIVRG